MRDLIDAAVDLNRSSESPYSDSGRRGDSPSWVIIASELPSVMSTPSSEQYASPIRRPSCESRPPGTRESSQSATDISSSSCAARRDLAKLRRSRCSAG